MKIVPYIFLNDINALFKYPDPIPFLRAKIKTALNYIRVQPVIILWHVDTMLGYDRKKSNYTTAFTRHRPVNSNRGTVFSVLSVPRYYKQNKIGVIVSCCCEKPVDEARGSSETRH
jgi:hypothetical protein